MDYHNRLSNITAGRRRPAPGSAFVIMPYLWFPKVTIQEIFVSLLLFNRFGYSFMFMYGQLLKLCGFH